MAEYPEKTSDQYVRESTYRVEPAPESTGSLWFILGGVVVALIVLFAIFYGFDSGTTTVPADGGAVTIENNQAAPAGGDADAVAPPPAEATPPAEAAPPADATAPAATDTAPAAPAATGN